MYFLEHSDDTSTLTCIWNVKIDGGTKSTISIVPDSNAGVLYLFIPKKNRGHFWHKYTHCGILHNTDYRMQPCYYQCCPHYTTTFRKKKNWHSFDPRKKPTSRKKKLESFLPLKKNAHPEKNWDHFWPQYATQYPLQNAALLLPIPPPFHNHIPKRKTGILLTPKKIPHPEKKTGIIFGIHIYIPGMLPNIHYRMPPHPTTKKPGLDHCTPPAYSQYSNHVVQGVQWPHWAGKLHYTVCTHWSILYTTL